MNEILKEVVKRQREKTPFGSRYIQFLQADIPKAIIDQVVFNIVAWQEKRGVLRTDRQFEYYKENERMPDEKFAANEDAIISNKSDDLVLSQMAEFREQNSLDMCPEAEAWFEYVTRGGHKPAQLGDCPE